MSDRREMGAVDLQFEWGKKRGVGGAKKDTQFYDSFKYDDIEYALYDCVYLHKEGELEHYIGKIVKIWEQPVRKRKVKILWFFRPREIQNYLGDYSPQENEIFLASGEGVGLTNINQLEAIAGKCCVICISKDERNAQPSKDEVEIADYIFNCTFDVGTFKISDKFNDKIAATEVKFLLNRDDMKVGSASKYLPNVVEHSRKVATGEILCISPQSDSSKALASKIVYDSVGKHRSSNLEDQSTEEKLITETKKHSGDRVAADPLIFAVKDSLKDVKLEGEERKSAKAKGSHYMHDDLPSKKIKATGDSVEQLDTLSKQRSDIVVDSLDIINKKKYDGGTRKLKIDYDEDDFDNDSNSQKDAPRKLKLNEKIPNSTDIAQRPVSSEGKDAKSGSQLVDVIRGPEADRRSRWFKTLPWEQKLQNAEGEGTLLLLQNLDPSLTSADVQDIMFHISNDSSVTAKVVAQATFQHADYGLAYAVFKSSEIANLVVQKMNRGCLVYKGRPIICSRGLLKVPPKSMKHVGHLSIEKIRIQMQREEMKRAVSTSHCSQPNTIEYEMALEWMLLQEKYNNWRRELNKVHIREQMKVKALNTK